MSLLAPLKFSPAGRYAPLDGYRALACLMIVVTHCAEGLRVVEDHPVLGANFLGYFAVVVFFTMSGFLVYKPFVDRHLAGRPAPATGRFLWQRMLRIYPLYWVVVTVYFLQGNQNVPGLWGYVRVYLLLQIYRPDTFGRGILAAWTLAVDISFYLVVPLLALAARKVAHHIGSSKRARLQGEIVVVLLFALLGPVWRCFWLLQGTTRLVDLWLPSQADFFGLGMAFALVLSWVQAGGTAPDPMRWLGRWPAVCFAAAVASFFVLGQLDLPLAKINPIDAFKLTPADQMARYFLYLVAAFFLFVPALLGPRGAASSRFFGSRPLRVMSELSYGLYLWHMLFLIHAADWLGGKDVAGFWPTLYIALVLSMLASLVTYLTVERPTARLRNIGLPTLPKRPGPGPRRTTSVRPTA
ncbi:MAG: acyltransferase [Acidimicrobiales bacterium]|nr:acyltransferase [Acidimicrobiales bacterium]